MFVYRCNSCRYYQLYRSPYCPLCYDNTESTLVEVTEEEWEVIKASDTNRLYDTPRDIKWCPQCDHVMSGHPHNYCIACGTEYKLIHSTFGEFKRRLKEWRLNHPDKR